MSRPRVPSAVVGLVVGIVVSLGLVLAATPLLPAPAQAAALPSGPDVSRWQHDGALDWSAVRRSGASFAVVKATEGAGSTNAWFAADFAAVRAQGMARGSYHFARPALPVSTARTQARHYAAVLGGVQARGDLPPVLDLEQSGGLSAGDLVTWAQIFLDELHAATGRTPLVYTYPYFWRTAMAGSTAFTRFPLWIASYGPAPARVGGWPTWTLWQYTCSARTPGIAGGVDGNRFNTATGALAALADGTHRVAWPVRRPSAPRYAVASAQGGTASVRWVPGDDGGARTTAYRVHASTGGTTVVSGSASRATVYGLPLGRRVSFTVVPVNVAGAGAASAATAPVATTFSSSLATWVSARSVRPGVAVTYWARLGRTVGGALPGRRISLYARPAGGGWQYVTSQLTDASGHVHWAYRPSRTTTLAVRYAGSAVQRPALGAARTVAVTAPAPRVTSRLSASTVALGGRTWLTGAVLPGVTGQLVLRQGWYAGAWHTWAAGRLPASHTYTFVVRPTVRSTSAYRVVVPAAGGRSTGVGPTLWLRVM